VFFWLAWCVLGGFLGVAVVLLGVCVFFAGGGGLWVSHSFGLVILWGPPPVLVFIMLTIRPASLEASA